MTTRLIFSPSARIMERSPSLEVCAAFGTAGGGRGREAPAEVSPAALLGAIDEIMGGSDRRTALGADVTLALIRDPGVSATSGCGGGSGCAVGPSVAVDFGGSDSR